MMWPDSIENCEAALKILGSANSQQEISERAQWLWDRANEAVHNGEAWMLDSAAISRAWAQHEAKA